ncbi:MAG: hypothetical protein KatS3mg077_3376 [Candidatus Binatia bacterium]|nr:MAG: hypothetical protein KatS3mg077_3376 [Candidatus Binatia bacterium]
MRAGSKSARSDVAGPARSAKMEGLQLGLLETHRVRAGSRSSRDNPGGNPGKIQDTHGTGEIPETIQDTHEMHQVAGRLRENMLASKAGDEGNTRRDQP